MMMAPIMMAMVRSHTKIKLTKCHCGLQDNQAGPKQYNQADQSFHRFVL
jgi:hypothetical protein